MQRAWNGLFVEELEEALRTLGEPAFRSKQIFHFFHVERGIDLAQSTTLPKTLREKLQTVPVAKADLKKVLTSRDGTKKLLLSFGDAVIETVFMPYADRNTLCVSTQVGCRQGCAFCASTKAPFGRNLRAEEILLEVYEAERLTQARVDNLVLMGIGEPLDNYEEVVRFLRLVTHPEGKNLSARSITLSTCGLVPQIRRLAEEGLPVNLAISLHHTSDRKRKKTMPVARRYSIAEILEACRFYFANTGRRVSFEYVLIRGENDSAEDVQWLCENLSDPRFHVNLIPLNEIQEFEGQAAQEEARVAFQRKLERGGVRVTLRKKRGADIEGACGQLRIAYCNEMEEG